ncbi:hypothetical protein CRT23_26555 [Methylobacterium sp. V23]|nr:hypothetical protein CRT23_26555 [Methylobacterium sp. V23]
MNTHQHARMTVHGRALLVNRILVEGRRVAEAAHASGLSEGSAYTASAPVALTSQRVASPASPA